jgi:hypothetical protein
VTAEIENATKLKYFKIDSLSLFFITSFLLLKHIKWAKRIQKSITNQLLNQASRVNQPTQEVMEELIQGNSAFLLVLYKLFNVFPFLVVKAQDLIDMLTPV